MDFWDFLIIAVRVVLAFVIPLVAVIFIVWGERKINADMTNRIGPNRAGPWGILQTVADGLKLFFKEQVTPRKAEFLMYMAAPIIAPAAVAASLPRPLPIWCPMTPPTIAPKSALPPSPRTLRRSV